jgi:hypothetical protein
MFGEEPEQNLYPVNVCSQLRVIENWQGVGMIVCSAIRGLVLHGDENSVTRDMDACAGLQAVKVNESILRGKIYDPVFLGYLHGYWEIIGGLWREIYIDGFFHEWWVRGTVINFHDMQLVKKGQQTSKRTIVVLTLAPVVVCMEKVKSLVLFS